MYFDLHYVSASQTRRDKKMSTLPDGDPYTAVEFTRLSIDECFVYKLPPYRTASGHRAEDWGLDKPALTGCCSLVQQDNTLRLRVFSENKVEDGKVVTTAKTLFAECVVNFTPNYSHNKANVTAAAAADTEASSGSKVANGVEGMGNESANDTPPSSSSSSSSSLSSSRAMELDHFVQPVADSSRYFVVRFSDAQSGKHAFLGLGFRERQVAFDFRATLQDFERSSKRELEAEARRNSGSGNGSNGIARGMSDATSTSSDRDISAEEPVDHGSLGLQSGQKIKLALKGKPRRPETSSSSSSSSPSASSNCNNNNGQSDGTALYSAPPPLLPPPTPPQPIPPPSLIPSPTAALSSSLSSAHESTAPMPTAGEVRGAPAERREKSVLKTSSDSALKVGRDAEVSTSSTSDAVEKGRARLAAALAANDTFRAQQIMAELANAVNAPKASARDHSSPVGVATREKSNGSADDDDDDENGDWGDFHSA